jgi:predicted dinucleotide-binding enzyme
VIDTGALTSSGLLQHHLPDAHVVKVFNNIYYRHLASLDPPVRRPDRTSLPIAGDDAAAKTAVTAYLDSIGYDAVRTRAALADSWHQEPDTPSTAPLRPLLLRNRPPRQRRNDPHRLAAAHR